MSRRWLVVKVESPSGRDDVVTEGLLACGAGAVVEEDGRLVTHFPEPEDPAAFLVGLREALPPDVVVSTGWIEDEDWSETWKRGLRARRISPRFTVAPTWVEVVEEPGSVPIRIDPGTAFGTGEHATTRGCIRLLEMAVREEDRVLDVGTGSGILAIVAASLGARVVAVEGDPLAHEAFRANVERNGVASRVRLVAEWADTESLRGLGAFDVAVANVLSGILEGLWPAIVGAAPRIVLGGLLEREAPRFLDRAASDALVLGARDDEEGWTSLLLERDEGRSS